MEAACSQDKARVPVRSRIIRVLPLTEMTAEKEFSVITIEDNNDMTGMQYIQYRNATQTMVSPK